MKARVLSVGLSMVALAAGCGSGSNAPDAGNADGSAPEAAVDAHGQDAGAYEAGAGDAGAGDAGGHADGGANEPPCGPAYGADEPVRVPGAGTAVYETNFDDYGTTADLFPPCEAPGPVGFVDSAWGRCTFDGPDAHVSVLVPGRGGAGKALRLAYDGVYQESHGVATNYLTIGPAGAVDTIYVTHCTRITTAAPLVDEAVAYKFILLFHQGGDRIQFNTHDHLPWTGGTQATYWQVYDHSRSTVSQAAQPVGPYYDTDIARPDATWHRFTYAYRQNSVADQGGQTSPPYPASSRDGFARMWIDGTKVIDISQATVDVTPPGGEKPWCTIDDLDALSGPDPVGSVEFGSVLTAGHTAFTMDVDDFAWWHSPGPPRAPL